MAEHKKPVAAMTKSRCKTSTVRGFPETTMLISNKAMTIATESLRFSTRKEYCEARTPPTNF